MKQRKFDKDRSTSMETSGWSQRYGSWLVILGLASGAWMALPEQQISSSTAEDIHLAAGAKESDVEATSAGHLGHAKLPFDAPANSVVSPSLRQPTLTEPLRSEEAAFSADPDAERVADNDSIPDDPDEVDFTTPSLNDAVHAKEATPPEVDFARAIARLNVAPPTQQLDLLDKIWALGLDLRQEMAALTVIEPLTTANDALLASRAAEAADSLQSALSAPRNPLLDSAALEAETDTYVMDLNARATADPDPLARRTAITELASHPHSGALAALATAAVDTDPDNRVQVISSLMRLADMGYQQSRIAAVLETMAARNSPEIASYAQDALKSLRKDQDNSY